MGKQMEGNNRQRRHAARLARKKDGRPSEYGMSTGASKQRTHLAGDADSDERLATTQRGESKQAGEDVPKPLRGKGRRKEPEVPPQP